LGAVGCDSRHNCGRAAGAKLQKHCSLLALLMGCFKKVLFCDGQHSVAGFL
jgi:hypothetical protein